MGWYDVPRPIVPDLIVQHGRNQARKPALLCGERRWTWAEFDAATNQVANGLLQLDLAPGARLAVLMQNSAEMALLLFGAGKAGVSVVPLNTSVSDAAVAAMVRDSGASAIAASGEHCQRVDALLAAGQLAGTMVRLGVDVPAAGHWTDLVALARATVDRRPRGQGGPRTPSATSSTARAPPGCPRASCTRTVVAMTGAPISPSRCATAATASPSARSGSIRTSAGSRC